jgi:hypothetical protein
MVVLQNVVEERNLLEEGIDDDERQKLESSYAALCLVLAALDSLCSIYLKCTEFQCLTAFRFLWQFVKFLWF